MHYAGVACDMDTIMQIARRHNLKVVEDAAQGVMASYKGRALGTIGDFGCYSFHETKNFSMGEGGALVINDPETVTKAEILREKGTNRASFLRGQVDKYTWVSYGSSYLPSDLNAASCGHSWNRPIPSIQTVPTAGIITHRSWHRWLKQAYWSCPPCRKAVCITGICSMSSCGTWNSAPRSLLI